MSSRRPDRNTALVRRLAEPLDNPGRLSPSLAEAVGQSPVQTSADLAALKRMGLVEARGRSFWYLTKSGRAAAAVVAVRPGG